MNDRFKKGACPGECGNCGTQLKIMDKLLEEIFGNPKPEKKPESSTEDRMLLIEADACIKGLMKQNEVLLDRIKKFFQLEKTLNSRLDDSAERIEILESMLGSKENEIEDLEEDNTRYGETNTELETEISRLKDCLVAAEKDLAIKTGPSRVITEIKKLLVLGAVGLSEKEMADKINAIKQLVQSEDAGSEKKAEKKVGDGQGN
jgi:septal ring factor EnvC (AmiA/AmiB activator)